jgi:hypothetical protein
VPPGAVRLFFYSRERTGWIARQRRDLPERRRNRVRPAGGNSALRRCRTGRHRVTIGAQGQVLNRDAWVDIAPGQRAFAKVPATKTWDAGGDDQIHGRDTDHARLMPSRIAQAEIGR